MQINKVPTICPYISSSKLSQIAAATTSTSSETNPYSKQLKFIKNQAVEVLKVLTVTNTHSPKQSLCKIKTSSMIL
jgi:hypothetical protein